MTNPNQERAWLAAGIALALAAATLGMCILGVNPFELFG